MSGDCRNDLHFCWTNNFIDNFINFQEAGFNVLVQQVELSEEEKLLFPDTQVIWMTFLDAVIASQIFTHPRFWVPLSSPVPKKKFHDIV